jgi:hypothetical protein
MLHRLDHDEHPPTGEPQDCKKCHKHLPARWFKLEPANLSGRRGTCLACNAAEKRAHYHRQHQTPQQKECRQCNRTLEAACFNRQRRSIDGLQYMCKDCQRTHAKKRKQPLLYVEVPTKRCSRCKRVKLAAAFTPARHTVDGLRGECKECH